MQSFFHKPETSRFSIDKTNPFFPRISLHIENTLLGYDFENNTFFSDKKNVSSKIRDVFLQEFQKTFQMSLQEYRRYLEQKEFSHELYTEQMEELITFNTFPI